MPRKSISPAVHTRKGAKIKQLADGATIQLRDGLINALSGLGTSRDRMMSSQFQRDKAWNPEELEAAYRDGGLARKIVDIIADDMFRKAREIDDPDLTAEQIYAMNARHTELGTADKLQEAIRWARLFGGAGLIPVYEGDIDMSQPMIPGSMIGRKIKNLAVISGRDLMSSGKITVDPLDQNYLLPEFYRLTGSVDMVHYTWVKRVDGLALPRFSRFQNKYWGGSALEAVLDDLKRALSVRGGISQMFDEVNIDILSVKGLAGALAGGNEEAVKQRYSAYSELKSLFKLIAVDAEEQFTNRQINVSGMADMLMQFYVLLASVSDIPATRLIGTSATGLNATGEGDLRNYYDMLQSKQTKDLSPLWIWADALIYSDLYGSKPPHPIKFKFPSLWQEPESEKETRLLTRAQRDQIYVGLGVVKVSAVAKQLQQDGVYGYIEDSDIAEIEQAEKDAGNELDDSNPDEDAAGAKFAAKNGVD